MILFNGVQLPGFITVDLNVPLSRSMLFIGLSHICKLLLRRVLH